MKKVKVIIGKPRSGKSAVAKALVSSIPEDEKVFLNGRELGNPFEFSMCTKNTKVIIIDDLREFEDNTLLIAASTQGIMVNKRGVEPFLIHPEIIIVCEEEITRQFLLELGASTVRRIEIIETIS